MIAAANSAGYAPDFLNFGPPDLGCVPYIINIGGSGKNARLHWQGDMTRLAMVYYIYIYDRRHCKYIQSLIIIEFIRGQRFINTYIYIYRCYCIYMLN